MAQSNSPMWPDLRIPENYLEMSYEAILMEFEKEQDEKKKMRIVLILIKKVDNSKLVITRNVQRVIKDRDLEKDFFQDLFLYVFQKLQDRKTPIKNFPGWLFTLTRNKSLNFIGSAENRLYSTSTEILEGNYSKSGKYFRSEENIDAREMLKKMESYISPGGWQIIHGVNSGESFTECAEKLGLTFTQFRGRYQRLRKKLIEKFGKDYRDNFRFK